MDVETDSLEELNLLTRDGARKASDALGEMVNRETTIDVTEITVTDREDVLSELREGDYHGVEFGIDGELAGTLLFVFDQSCIDAVTDLLVPGDASESMARSSVTELANIMMGGFMTGWGDHLGTGLDATPPTYLEQTDLESFDVDSVSPRTDSVLAFQSTVQWHEETIGIDIHLIPDRDSIRTIMASGAGGESSGDADDPFGGDEGDTTAFDRRESDSSAFDHTEESSPFDDGSEASPFGGGDGGDSPFGDATGDALGDEEPQTISLEKLSGFSDLTREGTETAAEHVSGMTGMETNTEMAGIKFIPVEDISGQLDYENAVGTTCSFEGTPSGELAIVFSEQAAINAAEAMLPTDPDDDGFTDMHRSAIQELGNIMTSGFIDGWANVLEGSVEHTPPEFVEDIEFELMEIITSQLGAFQTHAFSIESTLRTTDVDFECAIYAFPDQEDLGDALEALLLDRRDQTEADPSDLF